MWGSMMDITSGPVMTLQSAADHLLTSLELPPGVANVLPVSADDERLIVWVDSRYVGRMRDMPSCYAGYRVLVEARPEISTY